MQIIGVHLTICCVSCVAIAASSTIATQGTRHILKGAPNSMMAACCIRGRGFISARLLYLRGCHEHWMMGYSSVWRHNAYKLLIHSTSTDGRPNNACSFSSFCGDFCSLRAPILSYDQCRNQWRNGVLGIAWISNTKQHSCPWVMRWKQESTPIKKSHNSHFGNLQGSGNHDTAGLTVNSLEIVWFLNRYGFLL